MNGDVLTDLNYRSFWHDHLSSKSLASICTYRRTMTLNFGLLEVSQDGNLMGFQEKPNLIHFVSMGVNAFRREVLEYVPEGRPFGFDDLMLTLLERNVRVRCHSHSGRWLDIGRPDDYERAQDLLSETPTLRSYI